MSNRKSGIIFIKVDGTQYDAKGNFTYRINPTKREAIVGPGEVHGFKEMSQVNFIEGAITDSDDLDLVVLQQIDDATVTLELANEKTIVLYNAWYCADGDVTTEEAEVQLRFEAKRGEEIPA
jgi:hypothetical protein